MHFTYMIPVLTAFAFPAIAAVMRQPEITPRQQTAYPDYNSCSMQCVLECTMDVSEQWFCPPPAATSSNSSPNNYDSTQSEISPRDGGIGATFADEDSCFSGCNGVCTADTTAGPFVCEQNSWQPVDPAYVDPQNGSPRLRLRPRQQTMFSTQDQCANQCRLTCVMDATSSQWSCQDPVPTSADSTDPFAGTNTGDASTDNGVKPRDNAIGATFTDEASCRSGCGDGVCTADTLAGPFTCVQNEYQPVDPALIDSTST